MTTDACEVAFTVFLIFLTVLSGFIIGYITPKVKKND